MKHRLFSGHVRYVVVILAALLLFCNGEVLAKTYCVSDVGELQDALFFAEDNGQDDTIKLVQGTYTDSFVFSSMEQHSLALQGGYTAQCASRVLNPTNTILDGDNNGPVLVLNSNQPIILEVSGLTLQNGLTTFSPNGAGLYMVTSGGIALVSDSILQDNEASNGGGGILDRA